MRLRAPVGKGGKKKKTSPGELLVCRNAKASKRFEIEERLEAGLALTGSEVKSLRARHADLEGAYASMVGSELFLHKMHIAPYEHAGYAGHEPTRSRKLLLHRREMLRLIGRLAMQGYTLVPLQVYFKNGWAKVELGVARSKNVADRREDLRREQDLREARAAMSKRK